MATLSVWKFDDPSGADRALDLLGTLQNQQLITVGDSAVVSWEVGAKKPKTRSSGDLTKAGALGGSFWGLLFGLIFFVPLLGAALGAAFGALAGSLSKAGIDESFIETVRSRVTPGTSALFAVTSGAVIDRVRDAFKERGITGELLQTNLSNEQEAALRETFAE